MILICDKCLMASCWAGIFMCDQAKSAGLYRARKVDLLKLGLEHESYMDLPEVKCGNGVKEPILPSHVYREMVAANDEKKERGL